MRPWFERIPERFTYELEALRKAGYSFEEDSAARRQGRIVLTVKYPIDGEHHDLRVVFPDGYPYFPFEIFAPSFPAGRHKSPKEGLLCLLHQFEWSTTDTLAGMLAGPVRSIFDIHTDVPGASGTEAQEATQVTGHFHHKSETQVFTGKWNIPPEKRHGSLALGVEVAPNYEKTLRGAVLRVLDNKGSILASLDDSLATRYQKTLKARWVRIGATPQSIGPTELLSEAIKALPDLKTPNFKQGPDVVGILFPEESRYDTNEGTWVYEDNWVFVVRYKANKTVYTYLARADKFSRTDYLARVPRLTPISNKKVLVVGLGSVGSACAWQLARAGIGQLNVLDFDHLHFGNLPRWLMGFGVLGNSKAEALKSMLELNYPYATVHGFDHRIGTTDCAILPRAFEGVDLILDATAEWCVSHYLANLAKELGIPYVWVTGTPGSFGGIVGRIVPNKTEGCWGCFQQKLRDGTIKNPSQEESPLIQPQGCFHPTFTGTGFDMDHVSLAAVRLVVSTLCSGQDGGYPDFDWDVGVVDLWDDTNAPIAPRWKTYPLTRHLNCNAHE